MCMSLTRRLQLLLDEEQYERVADRAAREHRSVASVIREAIDQSLAVPDGRRRRAGDRILAADPMPVPDPDDLRRELDGLRGRHG